jgi:hypothetical protein
MQLAIFIVSSVCIALVLAGCGVTETRTASITQELQHKQTITHPELQATLLEYQQRDRDARERVVSAWGNVTRNADGSLMFDEEGSEAMRAMGEVDNESRAFIKQMILDLGWPSYDMVGEDGGNAAWLLAQHADPEPDLQEQVLKLMAPLVEQGQADGARFAMLTDRVLSGKREPQLYGTQFGTDADGVMRPLPTADWENVDQRRADVGLPSIAEYAASMTKSYNQPSATTPLERYPDAPEPSER